MKQYDCIVYGNDIYGLIVATYLARKMRKVLVIQDSSIPDDNFEIIDILDSKNHKYHIEYNPKAGITGLDSKGLTREYFEYLGFFNNIAATKILEETVVLSDNSIRNKIHTFDQFRVYLVRYYPKSRKQIIKFFEDLNRHYENYVLQFLSMLRNTSYTLSSLMIEWGDYSAKELLKKYFEDEELIKEFSLNSFINGMNLEKVSAYNFFSNYFVGLKSGLYYLENSEKEIREILISKLKLIDPNSVIKSRIKEIIVDKEAKINYLVDKEDKKYYSKYFFVNKNPLKFYNKYFQVKKEDINVIKSYYPNLEDKQYINTMYLAINQYPKNVGIKNIIYYFNNQDDKPIKIAKLFNYSLFKNENKRKNSGVLCVDFIYNEAINYSKDDILKDLFKVFPKLNKTIVGIKEGKPRRYLSMLSDKSLRKNLSINQLIDIEELEHTQVFENLYVGYEQYRPEAGMFGIVNQAMIYADKIEDRLYFGEDDDNFHYLNNEEIMMMIRHNYNYKIFGNQEKHINFYIGKHIYFVRTKGKNIVIHKGRYSQADLSIYTTNDRLSNLLLKKISFKEVLEQDSLKFRGDTDTLYKVIEAFNLDDYKEYDPIEYRKSKYKNLGSKFLFGYLGIYFVASLLSNYIDGVYYYPVAFLLTSILFYLKLRSYDELYWFDIFINMVYLIGFILSLTWNTFNHLRTDNYLLIVMSFTMIVSVFVNRPIVYNYTKFDQNIDYRNSVLAKIISSGLTFIWGFLFLFILVGTYIAGEKYVIVLYDTYFLGIFLMYYYPVIYVNTNIKQ